MAQNSLQSAKGYWPGLKKIVFPSHANVICQLSEHFLEYVKCNMEFLQSMYLVK